MNRIRTTAVAFTSCVALGFAAAPIAANAQEEAPAEPCATQQTQLERAEDALARVTAVFERQKDRVAKAKRGLAAADTARERRSAKATLALAKERKEKAAKEKKAQKQRVARASARLDACLAAQPAG